MNKKWHKLKKGVLPALQYIKVNEKIQKGKCRSSFLSDLFLVI
jgi:hypothetical protein